MGPPQVEREPHSDASISNAPFPASADIFLEPQVRQPRKTQKMLAIEGRYGGEALKHIIQRLHVDEEQSLYTIARNWDVGRSTVRRWVRKLGSATRSQKDAVALYLDDPKEKARAVVRLHTQEARENRRQAIKHNWQTDTQRRGRYKERRLTRLGKVFGQNPAERLEGMKRDGVTKEEIAKILGMSGPTFNKALKDIGITGWLNTRKGKGVIDEEDRAFIERARNEGILILLNERERLFINMRYQAAVQPASLTAVGEAMGKGSRPMTREGVRRFEKRLMKKIRRLLGEA